MYLSGGREAKSWGARPSQQPPVIDSQSAPTTQAGGPRGYDAGKRIYGRKRHIVTDTNGLLPRDNVMFSQPTSKTAMGAVTAAEEGAGAIRPRLGHVFADRIYRGKQLLDALSDCGPWTIEIVERPAWRPVAASPAALPRRWVVERTCQ